VGGRGDADCGHSVWAAYEEPGGKALFASHLDPRGGKGGEGKRIE